MILYNEQQTLFTLHTRNTTYQMKAGEYRVLLHTYYGPKVRDCDFSRLLQQTDRSFSPNPNEAGASRNFSLDVLPQEYSTCGVGDFRIPSMELELPNGSRSADLRYAGYEVREGKYGLEDLPAFFGGREEWETLIIRLRDAAADVEVELYYGVLEKYDVITRAVRVVNRGEETVRLCRCASLCLDFLRADMDLITFNGQHMMERCPERGPLRSGVQGVGSVRGSKTQS